MLETRARAIAAWRFVVLGVVGWGLLVALSQGSVGVAVAGVKVSGGETPTATSTHTGTAIDLTAGMVASTACYRSPLIRLSTYNFMAPGVVPVTTSMRYTNTLGQQLFFTVPPFTTSYTVECSSCFANYISHTLTVDLYDEVTETNEANNTYTTFFVVPSATPCPPSATFTRTPSHTPTMTRTAVAVTASATRTSTCCNPGGEITASCDATGLYEYDLTLWSRHPGCSITLSGPVDVYLQVADKGNGPWTTIDHVSEGTVSLSPGETEYLDGSFYQPSIPPPNSLYRVRWTMGYVNCLGQRLMEGYSTPAPICAEPSPTPTTIGTAVPPTATSGIHCFLQPTGASAACALPDLFGYNFSWQSQCPGNYPADATIYFEVSAGANGPWSVHTAELRQIGIVPGPNTTVGEFHEPNVPPEYNYFRMRITVVTPWESVSNQTSGVPICEGPTPTVTPMCDMSFWDVPPDHTFYHFVMCLACRGMVSGYADGTFRPQNYVTRGQLSKIVSNAAGFSEPVTGQTYADVPPDHTFYVWIGRLTVRSVMTGYLCGGEGEPCDEERRPYFRPALYATRGQTAQIVDRAAGFSEPPGDPIYADVWYDNVFYTGITRLSRRGVMSGYSCGPLGMPCDEERRPYFRWDNNVTRGQSAKIVANTFYPGCVYP